MPTGGVDYFVGQCLLRPEGVIGILLLSLGVACLSIYWISKFFGGGMMVSDRHHGLLGGLVGWATVLAGIGLALLVYVLKQLPSGQ